MNRARFSKAQRLSGQKAFAQVFGLRCSASNRYLIVYAAPNGLPYSRLGLSVGRRLGIAAKRNRIKRWLREAFRLQRETLPAGYDLVCVPRPGVVADHADYSRSLRSVTERAVQRAMSKTPDP